MFNQKVKIMELEKTIHFIGETVRQQRKVRGLTQYQLAEMAGVSQPHISDIENLRAQSVSIGTLHSLAKSLDLPFSCILSPSDAVLWREVQWLRKMLGIKVKKIVEES